MTTGNGLCIQTETLKKVGTFDPTPAQCAGIRKTMPCAFLAMKDKNKTQAGERTQLEPLRRYAVVISSYHGYSPEGARGLDYVHAPFKSEEEAQAFADECREEEDDQWDTRQMLAEIVVFCARP